MSILTRTKKGLLFVAALVWVSPNAMGLTIDDLIGKWNISYDMGQGAQTRTITVSRGADGAPAINMTNQGCGSSAASNISIQGEEISFSRGISTQGQALTVNYNARLDLDKPAAREVMAKLLADLNSLPQ